MCADGGVCWVLSDMQREIEYRNGSGAPTRAPSRGASEVRTTYECVAEAVVGVPGMSIFTDENPTKTS